MPLRQSQDSGTAATLHAPLTKNAFSFQPAEQRRYLWARRHSRTFGQEGLGFVSRVTQTNRRKQTPVSA
jgi:hypothetical protein